VSRSDPVGHGEKLVRTLTQGAFEIADSPDRPRLQHAGTEAGGLKAQGRPTLASTNPSSGTLVCLAARCRGLDVAGTLFRLGGEPSTPARSHVVAATGSRAVTICGTREIGPSCGNPEAVDDVDALVDKATVTRRARRGAERYPWRSISTELRWRAGCVTS
jgi:hypothetical protein